MTLSNNITANEQENNFAKLAKINVNGHTEKKGRFTYLSWTFAVSEAMKVDPLTNWVFREPSIFSDGTMMVHCDVTMFGKSIYMFLPVMNNLNKAIVKPNAFDINSAMMRCLVKGIAAHGLGLYIYAGEDLPEEEKHTATVQQRNTQPQQQPQKPKRTENQIFNDALVAIKDATETRILDAAMKKFKGTTYESGIANACRARADMMGWKSAPQNQQVHS